MNSKKFFYIMLGIIGLLGVLLVATMVLGDKMLQKQGDKLTGLKLEDAVIENQQTALVQAKRDVEQYADLEKIAKQIVPQDKDQARATREIINLARDSGLSISSVSFPSSNLGQAAPKPQTSEDNSSNPAPTTPSAPVTQVKPVDGITGVYQYDMVVISDTNNPATYNQFIDFLDKLEQNRRTAHVSQIVITPDSQNRSLLSFNLTITVYVKP